MLSLYGRPTRLCDRISRREWLRVGGLTTLGLSLPMLLRSSAVAKPSAPASASFGRAKSIIYLWLQGGPPQHETFDPKPNAPAEIRGAFRPIATNVPGIHFCELLPRTAAIADKLTIVRSLSTDDNNHDSSGYWLLTGYKYDGVNSREIRPTDWPYMGSVVKLLKPSETMPSLTSVWLPDRMRLNDNVQPAGQTGGFLGSQFDPERFVCDPAASDFRVEGLTAPRDVPPLRLAGRQTLLAQVEGHFRAIEQDAALAQYDYLEREALGLLTSGRARRAFAIEEEPAGVRDRYGRSTWGQSVLLARRLVEAGVRLVHVNWAREPGDTAVDNPMWDTHSQNAERLQDVLCPQLDVSLSALVNDLDERGLLEETLVVVVGEFGRSPKINANGGRDHWGHVFSCALAGAGISGGQVFGGSDAIGAYPAADRVLGSDLTATLFHLLGIDPTAMFHDPQGRPLPITKGEPIHALFGSRPTTRDRAVAMRDVQVVPPFDPRLLVNTDFEELREFEPTGSAARKTGWQASPLARNSDSALTWSLVDDPRRAHAGRGHAELRCQIGPETPLTTGSRAILTQRVRNPRVGQYVFSVHAAGAGTAEDAYREFLKHFVCRLVVFGYHDLAKSVDHWREFASVAIEPPFGPMNQPRYERYQISRYLRSQDGGAMELSRGIGVAIVIEPRANESPFTSTATPREVALRFDDVALEFNARRRDETVKV